MDDVLLVTVDSLRADHVGAYGYDRETTPNLDALADRGTRFTRAFSHACHTQASFPAILTSTYPLQYGGYRALSPDRPALAEVFADAGYRTGGFHSNLYLAAEFGYDRGFEAFYDSRDEPGAVARARMFVKDTLDPDGVLFSLLQSAYDLVERETGVEVGSYHTLADELTDRALGFVEGTADADAPRFLWVHYMDVHHPYKPPAEYQRRFRDDVVPDTDAIRLRRKALEDPDAVTDEEFETLVDLYDGEIRFTDAELGRLVEGVRTAWGEETVVAVTADHGEEFRDHGDFAHRWDRFYDEHLHVPLVVDAPTASEEAVEDLVGLLDLAPTLCALAGLDPDDEFEGTSLSPALKGGSHDREAVVAEDEGDLPDEYACCYRATDWKYVRRPDEEVLFDLANDPGERTDVLTDHPDRAEEFRAAVDGHRQYVLADGDERIEVEMDQDVAQRLRDLGYKE